MGTKSRSRSRKALIVAVFLWHGIPKAFDPVSAAAKFAGWGLPGVLGPITGWVEVVVAPLLCVRAAQRGAIAVLVVIIAGALATVQIPAGITAGLERDLLIMAALGLLAASDGGPLAIGRRGKPIRSQEEAA